MSPDKGPEKQQITLTVRSTSGEFVNEFNRNNKVEKVLDEAIRRLKLQRDPAHPYVVIRKTPPEKTLNRQEKLGDQGVRDADLILIQASEAEDG